MRRALLSQTRHKNPLPVRTNDRSKPLERFEGWRRAIEFVAKSDLRGDLLEFGCFSGQSMTAFYQAEAEFSASTTGHFIERFIGFDSFEGMPIGGPLDELEGYALSQGTLVPGGYACSEAQFKENLARENVDLSRVVTVKGFYEDSLKDPAVHDIVAGTTCALLHIDCDFEVSATAALKFATPLLQDGTIVLFDDWFLFRGRPDKGVRAAFDGWLPGSGFTSTQYFTYSWAGAAFILHTI
jgi:O-methyltransferase